MNKEWADLNKAMQLQIKKKDTFSTGINTLLELRKELMEQIFFRGDYQKRINASIITTGNELVKEEIRVFSKKLSVEELYDYIAEVDASTTQILKALTYSDIKEKISDESRKQLEALNVVSTDDDAYWLIDYWCGKDVKGLIQMPFSRHWIMHVEACLKIKAKLLSNK